MKRLEMNVDDQDFDAIQKAIARRQAFRVGGKEVMPEGDSDKVGALVAEICRGWMEMLDRR